MNISLKNTVFVFDLDDTLYKEADYHASGVRAVAKKVTSLYGVDVHSYLQSCIKHDEADLWGALCLHLDLPLTEKQSFIWEYRLHQPDITLSRANQNLLALLEETAAGLAILTDGRSTTQRLKLKALGLAHLPCFISGEHGGADKPDPRRFQQIANKFPNYDYLYIGDNPNKDFLAPNQLRWKTCGLTGDHRNIYSQEVSHLDKSYWPQYWITELTELTDLINA